MKHYRIFLRRRLVTFTCGVQPSGGRWGGCGFDDGEDDMDEHDLVAETLPCLALMGDEDAPGRPLVIVVAARPRRDTLDSPRLRLGERTIDFNRSRVTGSDFEEIVTAREIDLLRILVERRGGVVPRKELVTRMWGREADQKSSALDATVYRLRRKIEVDPSSPEWLVSVRGRGFMLEDRARGRWQRPLPMA